MKRICFSCLLFVICIVGVSCTQNENKNYNISKVIENNLETDAFEQNDVLLRTTYEKTNQLSYEQVTYLNNKEKMNEIYYQACEEDVPKSAVDKLQKYLGFKKTIRELGESIILYTKHIDFDLFVVDNLDELYWKVYLIRDDELREVKINLDKKRIVQGMDIQGEKLYLFSNNVYEIDLSKLTFEMIADFENEFGIDSTGEYVLMNEHKILVGMNPRKSDCSVYYLYNTKKNIAKKYAETDYIRGIFVYDNGYLVLCNKKESYKPVLKYFDTNMNLIKAVEISIKSKLGSVIFKDNKYCSYLNNDYLFVLMGVDGKGALESVVIDVSDQKLLYQEEIIYPDKYSLSGMSYLKKIDNKYIDLIN